MVISEGHFLVRFGISVHWLAGLLRQHRDDEFFERALTPDDSLWSGVRRHLRFIAIFHLEAQPLYLPTEVRSVERVFYMRAVWSG